MTRAVGCVMVLAAMAGVECVVACSDDDDADTATGTSPPAGGACEHAVAEILAGWQATIDERRDVPVEEFLAGERVYNLTEVPIGGADCEPAEATTLATDRAGTLDAATPVAALAKGIILADVAEMHAFGPGLDPDAPIAADVELASPDLDAIAAATPAADAPCRDWAAHIITLLQATIDLQANVGRDLVFEPQRFQDPNDLPDLAEAQELLGAAVSGERTCADADLAVEIAERWPQLRADGLAANVWLGGISDEWYGELSDVLGPD